MNTTVTAAEAYTAIRQQVENIRNDEHQVAGALSKNDRIAQGDVNMVRLEELPDDVEPRELMLQLAPGTTQGSRHILESAEGVIMYTWKQFEGNPLSGPILECKQPVRITHPEHGDWTIPEGVWHCRYQRAFAEELRRVQD